MLASTIANLSAATVLCNEDEKMRVKNHYIYRLLKIFVTRCVSEGIARNSLARIGLRKQSALFANRLNSPANSGPGLAPTGSRKHKVSATWCGNEKAKTQRFHCSVASWWGVWARNKKCWLKIYYKPGYCKCQYY